MPRAIVIGGGLAGMAAALALHESGFEIEIFEARNRPGGRAGSIRVEGVPEWIDAGQHILLGCCRNLLDFYRRLGVRHLIRFHDEYVFVEPGGRRWVLATGGSGPARLAAFLRLGSLGLRDKLAILRAMAVVRHELARREDLDAVSMGAWLASHRQTPRALARFWRPLMVSALNEEPERVSAWHALQALWLIFLASPGGARLGVPTVPLGEIYSEERWRAFPNIAFRLGTRVERVLTEGCRIAGIQARGAIHRADAYVLATPVEQARALVPRLDLPKLEMSPIVAVHLWFERPVMDLPQAALLDRTVQWAFNKHEGRYVQLVVSAARRPASLSNEAAVGLALRELGEFFPLARTVRLERALLVKQMRATFSPVPGLRTRRPANRTTLANLFLAGDWTDTGWPATMEGAVRSGYLAAEAATCAANIPARFLIPDPAP
ncbi:MAG: hydroxysqualene dehydroxylase HpnE [Bryobacterales bacterium]|nr:hydroxysqualene dehydroxylase HpnE [Bryobacteraceae bacterium]MDW8128918.1 hydroxysqualene dehydroxylase HpnE [Bryobacterales bacterium]